MNDAMRIKAIEADEAMLRAYRAWRKLRHPAGRHIRYYVKENRAAIDAAMQLSYDEFVRRVVDQRVRTQRGPA